MTGHTKWFREKIKNDPAYAVHKYVKLSARKRGIPFDLRKDDIVIPALCPILGIPLFRTEGKATFNTPSIDRIDSSKGYTKDNIQVISMRANTLKNNATVEELQKVLDFLQREK